MGKTARRVFSTAAALLVLFTAGICRAGEGAKDALSGAGAVAPYEGLSIYWGEIHGHTGFSDGYGLPDEYFYVARHINGLDFAAISDHAGMMNNWQRRLAVGSGEKTLWRLTIDSVDANYEPGAFVTLLGFEWTHPEAYGHRNVYFRDTSAVPAEPLDYKTYQTPEALWAALSAYPAFTAAHHTMRAETPMDMSHRNDAMERLVEVHSKWGASEHPYSGYEPMAAYRKNPELRQLAVGHSVIDMLNMGFTVGLIGGTDTHQGLPGSTKRDRAMGVVFDPASDPLPQTVGDFLRLLEQGYTLDKREPSLGGNGALLAAFSAGLTREAVWDALYDRRVYASTGPRAALYFSVGDSADSYSSAMMGEETAIYGRPVLRVAVSAEEGSVVEKVQLIRNGRVIASRGFSRRDVSLSYADASYSGGRSYYMVKVFIRQDEAYNLDGDLKYGIDEKDVLGPQLDEFLWSSPVWVDRN